MVSNGFHTFLLILHLFSSYAGSVDVWNDKVVRAGMSAHFHIPIYSDLEWSDISRFFVPVKTNPSEPSLSYLPRCFLADISNKATNEVIIHPSSLPVSRFLSCTLFLFLVISYRNTKFMCSHFKSLYP